MARGNGSTHSNKRMGDMVNKVNGNGDEASVTVREGKRRKVTKFKNLLGKDTKYTTVKDKTGEIKKQKVRTKYEKHPTSGDKGRAKYKATTKGGKTKKVTKGGFYGKRKVTHT